MFWKETGGTSEKAALVPSFIGTTVVPLSKALHSNCFCGAAQLPAGQTVAAFQVLMCVSV